MHPVLQTLLKVQALEFGPSPDKNAKELAELRSQVPPPILAHYDRLVARGKKGVAIVRNQVCTGCHMRLPIGTINTLMQGADIQLCDSCGRYLSLEITSEPEPTPAQPQQPAKPARKPRKPRPLSHAAA